MINRNATYFEGKKANILYKIDSCKYYLNYSDLDEDQYEEIEDDIKNYRGRLSLLDLEQRDYYKKDLTQPSSDKFKSYYPDQYREMEKGAEQRELQIKKDKQSREEYWKRYKNTTHHDAAKKYAK